MGHKIYRQGDLVLIETDKMPPEGEKAQGHTWTNSRQKELRVQGETGNTHTLHGITQMMVPLRPDDDLKTIAIVSLDDGAKITHTGSGETHPEMEIPKGTYEAHQGKEHENPAGVD